MTSRKNNQMRNKMIKSQPRNADANILDKLAQTFNNYHLTYYREEAKLNPHYNTKNHIRVPDFVFKTGKFTPVLEVDKDSTHGEFPYQNDQTKRRNVDHIRSGNPFSILNEDLAEHLGLDFGKLSVYLMWHSIAIHQATQTLIEEIKLA